MTVCFSYFTLNIKFVYNLNFLSKFLFNKLGGYMRKIILILISSFTFLAISFSANAIKVGALYLDTAGFFGEIKYGILDLLNAWIENHFINTLLLIALPEELTKFFVLYFYCSKINAFNESCSPNLIFK